MPPSLPDKLDKMSFDDLRKYLSIILKKELVRTGQIGKGTRQKFNWGNPHLKIP